ncbi:hypothetical protein ACFX19_028062 [Malus domestica]
MPLNFLYPNITKNVPPPELNADERWFLRTRLFDNEPRILFENNHVDKETLGDIQEDSMLCFSATDVDCYKPTLVDNNVQVLDAALEIDLNYWDVVVRDGKVDASNCENPNEAVEKFMDARSELPSASRSVIGTLSLRKCIKEEFAAEAKSSHCLEEID